MFLLVHYVYFYTSIGGGWRNRKSALIRNISHDLTCNDHQ